MELNFSFSLLGLLKKKEQLLKLELLKVREIYCLTIWEARNPKSRHPEGCALSNGSTGRSFLSSSSFWCLFAILMFFGLHMHHSGHMYIFSMSFHIIFLLCFTSFPPFYGQRSYWITSYHNDLILA